MVGSNLVIRDALELIFVSWMSFDDDVNVFGIVTAEVGYNHLLILLKNVLEACQHTTLVPLRSKDLGSCTSGLVALASTYEDFRSSSGSCDPCEFKRAISFTYTFQALSYVPLQIRLTWGGAEVIG